MPTSPLHPTPATETKNQWARDDPAFVVLLLLFISITAVAYGIAYKLGVLGTLNLILFMGFIDFLLVGAVVATIVWFFSNRFLIQQQIHSADQAVEWAYCFDVHCNAFFPVFLITYVVQFFFIPIVTQNGWISLFVGNTLYLAAIGYYFYVTHLGYNVLPFLRHPEVFLFPISVLTVLYVVSLVVWFNAHAHAHARGLASGTPFEAAAAAASEVDRTVDDASLPGAATLLAMLRSDDTTQQHKLRQLLRRRASEAATRLKAAEAFAAQAQHKAATLRAEQLAAEALLRMLLLEQDNALSEDCAPPAAEPTTPCRTLPANPATPACETRNSMTPLGMSPSASARLEDTPALHFALPCLAHNNAACPDDMCPFPHVCLYCRTKDHTFLACPEKPCLCLHFNAKHENKCAPSTKCPRLHICLFCLDDHPYSQCPLPHPPASIDTCDSWNATGICAVDASTTASTSNASPQKQQQSQEPTPTSPTCPTTTTSSTTTHLPTLTTTPNHTTFECPHNADTFLQNPRLDAILASHRRGTFVSRKQVARNSVAVGAKIHHASVMSMRGVDDWFVPAVETSLRGGKKGAGEKDSTKYNDTLQYAPSSTSSSSGGLRVSTDVIDTQHHSRGYDRGSGGEYRSSSSRKTYQQQHNSGGSGGLYSDRGAVALPSSQQEQSTTPNSSLFSQRSSDRKDREYVESGSGGGREKTAAGRSIVGFASTGSSAAVGGGGGVEGESVPSGAGGLWESCETLVSGTGVGEEDNKNRLGRKADKAGEEEDAMAVDGASLGGGSNSTATGVNKRDRSLASDDEHLGLPPPMLRRSGGSGGRDNGRKSVSEDEAEDSFGREKRGRRRDSGKDEWEEEEVMESGDVAGGGGREAVEGEEYFFAGSGGGGGGASSSSSGGRHHYSNNSNSGGYKNHYPRDSGKYRSSSSTRISSYRYGNNSSTTATAPPRGGSRSPTMMMDRRSSNGTNGGKRRDSGEPPRDRSTIDKDRSVNPCFQFNNGRDCLHGRRCWYRHACMRCESVHHGEFECDK
ncbi:Protein unc-50 [Podochytrium sp. JEL0797]|nr:Protein unc-50 [Podochytrium sp. JEL0797]